MTPLAPAHTHFLDQMIKRQALFNHPGEFFAGFFGGRVPTMAEKVAWIEHSMQAANPAQVFENDVYLVRVFFEKPFVHLDISRKDQQPCHNWLDFQNIKNELVGPQFEAIELYPAERRLVNTSHQYHLWVHTDPTYEFPVGFHHRWVLRDPIQIQANSDGTVRTSVTSTVPLDSAATAPAATVGTAS